MNVNTWVKNIINNIKLGVYEDNVIYVSFGTINDVELLYVPEINFEILKFIYKKYLSEKDIIKGRVSPPQVKIRYNNYQWFLEIEYYNPNTVRIELSHEWLISELSVKNLLKELLVHRIRIYDIFNKSIL